MSATVPLSTHRVPAQRGVGERKGFAMLAALWLVVVMAAAALQFSIVAQERRALGLHARDRATDRAAAIGALAEIVARMEFDLRTRMVSGTSAAQLRAADPWLEAERVYSSDVTVGDRTMAVEAFDLGSRLNLNLLDESELRTLFADVLRDADRADHIAQSIMDWRDVDDSPRARGAERAAYLREGRLALPSNSPFRNVNQLAHVIGMTPEILATVQPYLTTVGTTSRVNLNTAPAVVLRALPGMTEFALAEILRIRQSGQRVTSAAALFGVPRTSGRGNVSPADNAALRLQSRTTFDTRDLMLTISSRSALSAQPVQLVAVVQRVGNTSVAVTWQQW